MDFLRLFLGACAAMLATALGAAGVMAFRRIDSRLYALIISFCAGMMAFSALEMITQSHALAGHRIASSGFLVGLIVSV